MKMMQWLKVVSRDGRILHLLQDKSPGFGVTRVFTLRQPFHVPLAVGQGEGRIVVLLSAESCVENISASELTSNCCATPQTCNVSAVGGCPRRLL